MGETNECDRVPELAVKILCVGDTHGDVDWFHATVERAALQFSVNRIVQVGDFGWWPGSGPDLNPPIAVAASEFHATTGIPTWFCDGNHEHFPSLKRSVDRVRNESRGLGLSRLDRIELLPGLSYLPRGHRFVVDDCRFAVLGGAHSIDRGLRVEGVTWFVDERVTGGDLAHLAQGGGADVLISHDAPAGYPIPGLPSDKRVRPEWRPELRACHSHRDLVRIGMRSLRPRLIVHGHYHQGYSHRLNEMWDNGHRTQVQIEGLAGSGQKASLALIEIFRSRPHLTRIN